MDFNQTQKLNNLDIFSTSKEDILIDVYTALQEKGYNPTNQIVGYLLSGDPTYITSHNQARVRLTKIERDELLEMLVNSFLRNYQNQ